MIKKLAFLPLFVFLALGIVASCQDKNSSANQAGGGSVSVEEFDELLQSSPGAYVIDVRTAEEFAEGHVKNAVNIDVNSASFEAEIGKLDTSKAILVYCLAGSRSASAATYMRKHGFKTVYEMKGGILKWKKAGKPLVAAGSQNNTGGLTPDEFTKLVTTENYVLVDYHAKWCKPCKEMAPMLDKVAADKKDKLTLLKIDADANDALLQQKGIDAIPVLELYHKGKLVWKHQGAIDEVTLLQETKL